MLATQVRQADSVFYFVAYPAEDLLRRVKFISRFHADGETIAPAAVDERDDVARFIARIERSDAAFQRRLSRAKVQRIKDFYASAASQPPIPGTVLLFAREPLAFQPVGNFQNVGDLAEPPSPYLIIDGQHRLAALKFFMDERPDQARTIHVPCVVFDGRAEDFATEMFVIINSTPTRINKSHLIDLYERVSYAGNDKKLAASACQMLYAEADSPLRYRIDRLGGRSRQRKWILQAELFNEVHRWVRMHERALGVKALSGKRDIDRVAQRGLYEPIRDGLRAARAAFGEAWDDDQHVIARAVTLKAMIRVFADLWAADRGVDDDRSARWSHRLEAWATLVPEFRADGFFERFAARGQSERVGRVHARLAQAAGIDASPERPPRPARGAAASRAWPAAARSAGETA